MRIHIVLVAALLIAAPATAQRLGARTETPEQMLSQMGSSDEAELAQAVAAADAHPLGSQQNPVRVGGPDGARAYLARLRCSNGAAPTIGQRTSGGIGAFGTIVDAHPVDCGSAAPGRATIMMDMYHAEHRENRAPPGFQIQP